MGRSKLAALLFITLSAPVVQAQVASEDKAAATKLFDEGLALLKSKELAGACSKLKESQRLDPALGTLLYLSECYARRGQTASAWAGFREAAELAQRLGDRREKSARDRAAALHEKLSMLTIDVPKEARVPGLVVMRDGQNLSEAMWQTPLPVDPGEHLIEVRAPGRKPYTETLMVTGDGAKLTVAIKPLVRIDEATTRPASSPSAPAFPPAATTAPPQGEGATGASTVRVVGYVAGGVGLAGMIVGGLLLRSASKMGDESRAQHDLGLYDDAKNRQTWGRVSLGAGAALLGGGVVLVLTAPAASSTTSTTSSSSPPRMLVHPIADAQALGLSINGAW